MSGIHRYPTSASHERLMITERHCTIGRADSCTIQARKCGLVGGLEHEFYFSIYLECHHPNWRSHIFQRGFSTTNQWFSKAIFWAGRVQDPRPTFKLLSYGLWMFMDVYGRYDCDYYYYYLYIYIYVCVLYIYILYYMSSLYIYTIVPISLLCMV